VALREIVRLGHPALRAPAAPLPPARLREAEVQALIDDMLETMRAAHGIGLAAPQLGIGWQLFVYQLEGQDPRALVNPTVGPTVEPHGGELVYDWEGCLSIPDLRGLVPRHPAVRSCALDRFGGALDYVADGLEARVIQHEYDHLNGVVFLDRMRDFRSLAYSEELERYLAADAEPGSAVG
jgi:peptide deformylase